MRRTPLKRRRLFRPWRRPEEDKVTDELMEALYHRDRGCVLARVEPGEHECRDRWGVPHAWNQLDLLTPEHFWEDYAVKGKRAPSDLDHTVLLCAYANINAPSKVQREKFRDWVVAHR